jgi:predicted dehydrogenase
MAKAVQNNGDSTCYAVFGRNIENLKKIQEQFKFTKTYTKLEDCIADPNVDAIYIALPTHLHARAIMLAARENKAILCEKALTLNWHTAHAAMNIVAQEKCFFMEALMYRCHPYFEKIVQTIEDKTIGDVKQIDAFYHADIHQVANPLSGGTIFNLGCYPVSTVLQFCKSDINVSTINDPNLTAIKITAKGFQNQKITANIESADDQAFAWKCVIKGSKGILEAVSNPWFPESSVNHFKLHFKDQPEQVIDVPSNGNAYDYQIARVVESVKAGQLEAAGLAPSKAFSLEVMRVLEAWNQHQTHSPHNVEIGAAHNRSPKGIVSVPS